MNIPNKWLALYQEDPEAIDRLASDPATAPSLLAELAQALTREVGALLAQNPSTPLPTLRELGQRHPRELFQNPLLPLLLLEGAGGLESLCSDALCAEESAPSYFLGLVAMRDSEYAELLALHPNTPADALSLLFQRGGVPWRLLLQNPACPAELLSAMSRSDEARQRAQVASHVKTPPAVLERLAQDPAPSVRAEVARHPKTPEITRALLSRDRAPEVSRAARSFPTWLSGSNFSLREVARAGFQAGSVLSIYQSILKASETFKAQYETYRDEDCLCCWCYLWRDDELTSGDNTINPLDIGGRQLHRKRQPKTDPNKRKSKLARVRGGRRAPLALNREIKQSRRK